MTRVEDHLRLLDPVDARAPDPDGEALLREILADRGARPVRPRPRKRRAARLALGAVACAAAAGIILVVRGGAGADVVAAAHDAISRPGTILHYRQRWTQPADVGVEEQHVRTTEVWELSDGSRRRELVRSPGERGIDEWVTAPGSIRMFDADSNEIVVGDDRGEPGAQRQLGDPRMLLGRARSGDAAVEELGEATVRGIPVLQFRVGECRRVTRKVPVIVEHADGRRERTTRIAQGISYAIVVSVARDSHLPVRMEEPPCRRAPPGTNVADMDIDQVPGMVVDYLAFEALPATPANRRLLEMGEHPGARVRG
jgi:hypothetical protein